MWDVGVSLVVEKEVNHVIEGLVRRFHENEKHFKPLENFNV